jgi:hypothetical protein
MLMLGTATALAPIALSGQSAPSDRAALVLRLLPPQARSAATVILRDGDSEERFREGNGRFLCASDITDSTRISMVCHHHVLEQRLRYERQLSRETGLTGGAFRERLCSDVARRGWSVPDGAMEITASLSRGEDGTYASEMTVYHVLWLPHQTTEGIGVADEDPGQGRPYLHQAGTCGAHVMWSAVVSADIGS